jgi:hypothetical protein
MTRKQPEFDWRESALDLAWKLNRAHNLVDALGTALANGDDVSAQRSEGAAHNAVNSVARRLEAVRSQLSPDLAMTESDAVGSTLAIGGSGVATVALDVMVNAKVALAATDEADDADFLVRACADAENAYEVAAAVVKAVPGTDGPAAWELRRAFETEGGIALRRRLTKARPRVRAIYQRVKRAA